MKNINVLGVPLSMLSRQDMLNVIEESIHKNQCLSIVAINARKIVLSIRQPEVKELINKFDIFLADGSSIVKAVDHKVERIAGIDLMEDICKYSGKIGARIFFYGASEKSNEGARRRLKILYPDIQIVGYCNGYDDEDVLEKISDSGANVVFVAKGTPVQEQWIMQNRSRIKVNVLMGVGGSFDVFSGKVNRAPKFLQKVGLEWLYRMVLEPTRFKQIPELMEFERLVKKQKKM